MTFRKRLMVPVLALAAVGIGYQSLNPHHPAGDSILLYGNVDIREVELAFRQSGRLLSAMVEEGDTVAPGQLLAELDAQPFRETVAVAEATARQAAVELEKLKRGYRTQEIAEAEQTVHQAEAAHDYAVGEVRRQANTVQTGATTRSGYEQAVSARDQAAARLASARETLAMKREGYRREDIAGAEARLAGAQAALAQARTALADTRLAAPARAVVLTRAREPGSMVGASVPVYTLSLRDPVYVRAYVDESQLGQVVPGTAVSLRSDSSAKTYQGRIGFVSPRAEFTPKSVETAELRTDLVYRLRIVVGDADDGLRQGMPVTITLGDPPAGN